MKLRMWIALGAVVAVAAAAAGVISCTSRDRTRPRTVFLIVIDTLRADRLTCYGYDDNDTRHIDALAGRGVTFDNALTVGSWTIPSMGAIMTSLYPTQLGLVEQPSTVRYLGPRQLREQIAYTISLDSHTMSESFSAAGYRTVGFVNQPTLNNRDGFVQGFDEWFYPVSRDTIVRRDLAAPLVEYERTLQRRTTWETTHDADPALVDAFVEWMDTTHGGDAFVWLHLSTPHKPYEPAAQFMREPGERRRRGPKPDNSALYDGEVRATDALIGRILDAIERNVGFDETLIVFTSDHGEEFGEHGMDDHGHTLHRECVQVPLVVAGPGWPAGRRVAQPVRLVDVLPTILAACAIDETPAGMQGVDLAPAASGSALDLPVYSEGMLYGSTERSLLRGDFRLMWDEQGDVYRLFQPSSDVMEQNDVAAGHRDVVERMRSDLAAFHETLARDYELRLSSGGAADSAATAEERARVLKAMKSLGYVGD